MGPLLVRYLNGFQIDHINTYRDDNSVENLQAVTPKENSNNFLTKQHQIDAMKGKPHPHKGKPWSKFGKKFFEHFRIQ